LSASDAMLLDGSDTEDNVVVEELHGDDEAFVARIEIAQFRLRMRVIKRVCVEFITRDRMWCLTYSADQSDAVGVLHRSWTVTLELECRPLPFLSRLSLKRGSWNLGQTTKSVS